MTVGRKPKPTALKLIDGTAKCRIRTDEPDLPQVKSLRPPDHLSDEAKAEYRRLGRLLRSSGVLTAADLPALALYAQTYAIWLEATRKVERAGMVVKGRFGIPMRNPYMREVNDASKRMQSLLSEFGMTPASRTRVSTGTGPTPSANAAPKSGNSRFFRD